jgi:DNA-binding NarL/FixJ family response regulator
MAGLLHPVRVLLVDDSPTFLQSAAQFLSGHNGIAVSGQARSGQEAVAQVQRLQPDLVLMDVAMPGLSGLEATRLIKRLPEPPRVIIVTMADDPEYRVVAAEAGADGFVPKPRCRTELLPLIQALFALPDPVTALDAPPAMTS